MPPGRRAWRFYDGQTLDIPMELSAVGIARKGDLEAQTIAREQSAADAQAKTTVAGGMPAGQQQLYPPRRHAQRVAVDRRCGSGADSINVIQQK